MTTALNKGYKGLQLPKMNVSRFAISLSKTALFKRAWQTLKVLPRH